MPSPWPFPFIVTSSRHLPVQTWFVYFFRSVQHLSANLAAWTTYEVSEVVSGMEGQPLHIVHEAEARDEHELGEGDRVDALLLVLLELNPGVLKQVDRVLCVHVFRQVELEVELPSRRTRVRKLPFVVEEGETELDDLQKIDVASQQLVLVVGRRLELTWEDLTGLILKRVQD